MKSGVSSPVYGLEILATEERMATRSRMIPNGVSRRSDRMLPRLSADALRVVVLLAAGLIAVSCGKDPDGGDSRMAEAQAGSDSLAFERPVIALRYHVSGWGPFLNELRFYRERIEGEYLESGGDVVRVAIDVDSTALAPIVAWKASYCADTLGRDYINSSYWDGLNLYISWPMGARTRLVHVYEKEVPCVEQLLTLLETVLVSHGEAPLGRFASR